ncbi:probable E3 ubiquitin-protein ligase HERC4 isoform X2 [Corticium candelabrum]|nr:probable E3 ubiquitin-protein ligase HERC4 isoform X2 [Corticium candelabrum]
MYSWGRCSSGQLGQGGIDDAYVSTPLRVKAPVEDSRNYLNCVISVGCGWEHTVIATEEGELYSCGSNDHGQLGLTTGRKRFERVGALETKSITQVSCGCVHTVALSSSGEAFTWGSNSDAQLGIATVDNCSSVPRLVKGLCSYSVVQVSCGDLHTLVLTADCQVYGWGSNSHWQVGLPHSRSNILKPERLKFPFGVPLIQVAAGGYHSLALTVSGHLYSWGKNEFGQLGVGDKFSRSLPTLVTSLPRQHICYVACGEDHSAALTKSGAVFTFGSSGNGQLGHNMQTQELRPKQVAELMGSEVIQIACGRQHMLALVQSGRLYSWGLGGSGQLGLKSTKSCSSPCAVTDAEWTSRATVVQRICAGGDQSFACVVSLHCLRLDFRQWNVNVTPSFLSQESLETLIRNAMHSKNFVELLRKLEIVLTNASLINGSFVLGDENSEMDGALLKVDMSSVRQLFKLLDSIQLTEVKQTVEHVFTILVHNLTSHQLSIMACPECFRVFVIVPECELFIRPLIHCRLIGQFASAIISLNETHKQLISEWYQRLRPTFFERVVLVFHCCVSFIVDLVSQQAALTHENLKKCEHYEVLVSCLSVLSFCSQINEQSTGLISHKLFYVKQLNEAQTFDLNRDYVHFLKKDFSQLSFCRFSFVYDMCTKAQLLKADAHIQMQSAVHQAHIQNLQSLFLNNVPQSAYLFMRVRRENLLQDTLDTVVYYCSENIMLFKKPLLVTFVGEEGHDAGGVKKEFFLLLMQSLLNPDFGMFTVFEESQLTWFLENSMEELQLFRLVGIICGLAIYNSVLLHTNFPLAVYKKLLDRTPRLEDLAEIDPSLGRSLQGMLDYQEDDFEDTFNICFQIDRRSFGELQTFDLVPGGARIAVTKSNRQDYVDAYVDYVLNKCVTRQFGAFADGFRHVCSGKVLELLHPKELQAIVSGYLMFNLKELEEITEYGNGFHRHHFTIEAFWEVVHELGESLRKKFLIFLTGSDRIPITGLKSMKVYIQRCDTGVQGDRLPVAHTCFNVLDLPEYGSKTVLRDKLIMAITQTEGFGLV